MNIIENHNLKINCTRCKENFITKTNMYFFCESCLKKQHRVRSFLGRKKLNYKKRSSKIFFSQGNRHSKSLKECIMMVYDFSLEKTKLGKFFINLSNEI
jgi:hypothetical protein